jgi:hypothetical protein
VVRDVKREDARRGSGQGIDRLVAGPEDAAGSCCAHRSNSGVCSGKSQIPKHASTLITSWDSHLDCVVLGRQAGEKRTSREARASFHSDRAGAATARQQHAAFCRVCGEHSVGLQLTERSDTSLLVGIDKINLGTWEIKSKPPIERTLISGLQREDGRFICVLLAR